MQNWLLLTVGAVLMQVAVALYVAAKAREALRANASCTTLCLQLSDALANAKKSSARFAELADEVNALQETLHKLRSREGMRDLRARRAAQEQEDIKGAAWKDKMRAQLKLHMGAPKP